MAMATLGGALFCAVVIALIPPTSTGSIAQDAVRRAELLEQGIAAQVRKVRPDDAPWAISIEVDDVNAWLSTRLPKWIAHDTALKDLEDATRLVLSANREGVGVVSPLGPFAISVVLQPSVNDARALRRLQLQGVHAAVGRLPLPFVGEWLLTRALTPALHTQVTDGVAVSFRLGDGRVVELLDVETSDGKISLQFRTLKSTP